MKHKAIKMTKNREIKKYGVQRLARSISFSIKRLTKWSFKTNVQVAREVV